MAIAAGSMWEIRADGDDTNSGGFDPSSAGTDRTQQTSPHVVIDGSTITATVGATTTHLTMSGYTVDSADVGNTVKITGGTMTAGIYQITAISGSDWVLDKSAGTAGQTGTGRMGGAIASLGQASADNIAIGHVAGLTFWVRAASGDQVITSTTASVPGGRFIQSGFSSGLTIEGYTTTRGDGGRFVCRVATTGFSTGSAILQVSSSRIGTVKNLEFDGNGAASFSAVGGGLINGWMYGGASSSYAQIGSSVVTNSFFDGTWARATNGAMCYNCYFIGGAQPLNSFLVGCVLIGGTGNTGVNGCRCVNSVLSGFQYAAEGSFTPTELVNCWIHECDTWWNGSTAYGMIVRNSFRFGSMTDDADNTAANNRRVEFTDVATDPFIDAAGLDFRLTVDALTAYRTAGVQANEEQVSGENPWTDVIPYSNEFKPHPLYATGRR